MAEDSFEKARKAFFASTKRPPKPRTSPVEFKARSEPRKKADADSSFK